MGQETRERVGHPDLPVEDRLEIIACILGYVRQPRSVGGKSPARAGDAGPQQLE